MTEDNYKIFIECVGVDGKIHYFEPHKNTCVCGMKISCKKLQRCDLQTRYWCGDCDSTVDYYNALDGTSVDET